MKAHAYRVEVLEVQAETLFESMIQIYDNVGNITGIMDDEKQDEIKTQLAGKVFIKCLMEDLAYDQAIILNSPLIEPANAGYWVNQMISQANKKIAKLIGVKNKSECDSPSLIIIPDGSFPKN